MRKLICKIFGHEFRMEFSFTGKYIGNRCTRCFEKEK